jgi:hypothetical protein
LWPSPRSRGGGDTSTAWTTFDQPPLDAKAVPRDEARELLGQAMGYAAVTVGFAALGAYLGRDLSGATAAKRHAALSLSSRSSTARVCRCSSSNSSVETLAAR